MKRGVRKKSAGRETDFHHVLLTGVVALVVIFSLVVIFTYGGTTELDDGVYFVEEGNIVDEEGNLVGEASFRRRSTSARRRSSQLISTLRGEVDRLNGIIAAQEEELAACPVPECSTPIDDDGDGLINEDDPACIDPITGEYDANILSELNCGNPTVAECVAANPTVCSSDFLDLPNPDLDPLDPRNPPGGGRAGGGGAPPPSSCGDGTTTPPEECDPPSENPDELLADNHPACSDECMIMEP